ncbi:MAG TPA: hypothetical protein VIC71_10315 [Gammaproteobacteria bacterium]
MKIIHTTIRTAAAVLAASVSPILLAQTPPAPDIELPVERQTPAEQTAAAYKDPSWSAPRTSWGDPSLQGTWSTDDMRGIPRDRPRELGTQESLSEEQFLERARTQEAGRNRAVNEETFLRNEWGTRTFGYTSLVVDPPDGRTPATTEAARARAAATRGRGTFSGRPLNTFEDFSLYDRCIGRGISNGMGAAIYGNGIQIFQSPDVVTITYEMIHETRVIPLDDRPYLEDAIPQFTGNGRGHWDGDTLVIESQGFTDRTSVGGGASNSRNLHTTERIRRVDPEMIEYRITINDPDTYAAPFSVRLMWTTQPDYYAYEYSCHEGNSAVRMGLSGERAYERQVAEAVAAGREPPRRSNGNEVYRAPSDDAKIFDINEGE